MTPFPYRSYQSYNALHRHPTWIGIPLVILIVAASFGLQRLTQTRYDLQARKVSEVSEEEKVKLKRNRKKVDLREEYFKLRAKNNEDWEPIRIPRPEGVPEWGVPPDPPTDLKK